MLATRNSYKIKHNIIQKYKVVTERDGNYHDWEVKGKGEREKRCYPKFYSTKWEHLPNQYEVVATPRTTDGWRRLSHSHAHIETSKEEKLSSDFFSINTEKFSDISLLKLHYFKWVWNLLF